MTGLIPQFCVKMTIDNISVNDDFWIQFKDALISFGGKALPKDIHYTISFEANSPYLNFHITKNVSNQRNKPQIKILKISKQTLLEVQEKIAYTVLSNLLEPLKIEDLKMDCQYFSLNNLLNSNKVELFENRIIECFRDISKIRKKTRLKIRGDVEKSLINIGESEELTSIIENDLSIFSSDSGNNEAGIVFFNDDEVLLVIWICGICYTIKENIKLLDLLLSIIPEKTAKSLIWKTKRGIIAIKSATSYEEIKHLDKPVLLKQIHPSAPSFKEA